MTRSTVLPPINPMDMHTPMSRVEARKVLRMTLFGVLEDGLDHFKPLEGFSGGLPLLDVSSGATEDGSYWYRAIFHEDPEITAVVHEPEASYECWHPRLYQKKARGEAVECFHIEIAGHLFHDGQELFSDRYKELFWSFLRSRMEHHIQEAEESDALSD